MTNPEETQGLRPETLRRVEALACLHPTTRAALGPWLTSQATAEQLAAWRDKNLAFLERWVAPVSAPAFADLCQRLNGLESWESLRNALRLPDGATPGDWLRHANYLKLSPPECLWCLAQQLGQGAVLDGGQTEALVRSLFSKSVLLLNYPKQAAAVLEEFGPLTEQDYADAGALSARLQRFVSERQLPGNNAAFYVRTLADALRFVNRPRHAALALEAFVPLGQQDYADAPTLGRRLQRFAAERELEGNTAANYVQALAEALLFVNRPRHAALALEAFVPLGQQDYADAPTLGRRLQHFAAERQLEGNSAANYVLILADAVRFAGRPRDAALALEAFVPLGQQDYADAPTLGRRLQRFAAERQLTGNCAANYVQALVEPLVITGRPRDAALALEGFVPLGQQDYADAPTLSGRLQGFAAERQLTGNNTALYVLTLANVLRFVSRPRDAALALEAFVPLGQQDYADAPTLGRRLQRFAAERQLTGNSAAIYVLTLAEALRFVSRPRDAALALEAFVPLGQQDYADAPTLGRRLQRFAAERQMPGNNAVVYVLTLAEALRFAGRPRQAALALEAFVPLAEADYAAATLSSRLQRFAAEHQLTGNNAAFYVQSLAEALFLVGRPRHAALALEAFVPLAEADYAAAATLGSRLQRFAAERELEGNSAANYVEALAEALRFVGRPRHAALALEAFVPLGEQDYADAATLGSRLQRFAVDRQLINNNAVIYVRILSDALRSVSRPRHAALALEAFVPLAETDYAEAATLSGRLQRFAADRELEENTTAVYVATLADALSLVGRPRHAALALEAFTRGFTFLEVANSPLTAGNAAGLVSARLRCGFADPDEGARLLERFMVWLRSELRNAPAADKAQEMENIAALRRQAIAFADAQAQRVGLTTDSVHWRKRGLVWDAWLGQRVLQERMLIGRLRPTSTDRPPPPKKKGWPYPEKTRRPSWAGHRASRGPWTTSANVQLDAVPADVLAGEEVTEGHPLPSPLARATTPEPWQALVRERLNAPYGERELAADLGQQTLLLRAGVGPDGGLHWSAWQADGAVLRLVAHEPRTGQPDDWSRLAWCQRRHDLRIALAYVERGARERVARILDDISFQSLGRDSPDERLETLKLALHSTLDQVTTDRLLRIVRQALQVGRSPQDDDLLGEEWPKLVEAARRVPLGVVDDLNSATAELIAEAGSVWDLSPLEGRLDEGFDVVLVADSVLHGLPFAHLQVGGQALFTQVRSTRSSLSLVLDAIQREIENAAPEESAPRVSGAAWVPSGDAARRGGIEFLHGLSNLGREFSHGLSLAADRPAADIAWLLRQPTQDGPARVFGWYGHGHEEEAGIVVGPGRPGTVCKGEGMRLELFELILVIACSLGRHRQTGALDAESFCCDLTLNGMRSAVAARWPVHAGQAADVGNEIARQYLLLRREHPRGGADLTRARIRARALNLARGELLKAGSDYLNTLAAFELWGLA